MEVNGIAHIQLTVNHFETCVAFYRKLLPFLEMKPLFDTDKIYYCIGSRTGVAITPADPKYRNEPFAQRRIGLHHLCFRARAREDIDTLHQFLVSIDAKIVHPPEDGPWAPGYYSILFEDPDGIRLEANYVPGKGNLDPAISLPRPVTQEMALGTPV